MPQTANVDEVLQEWPEDSRKVANWTIENYGQPDEVTPTRLIWHNTGPWKRTTCHKEPVEHRFPQPHTDILEQVLDYRVPPGRFDDLARFDGSVVAKRTRGELGAMCHWEDANFLAVNLAHTIITGENSVEEARRIYAETMVAFQEDKKSELVEGLIFSPPQGDQRDPDEKLIDDEMKQRVKEKLQGADGQVAEVIAQR